MPLLFSEVELVQQGHHECVSFRHQLRVPTVEYCVQFAECTLRRSSVTLGLKLSHLCAHPRFLLARCRNLLITAPLPFNRRGNRITNSRITLSLKLFPR